MHGEVEVNKSFACLALLAFLVYPVLVLAAFGFQMVRLCSSLNRGGLIVGKENT